MLSIREARTPEMRVRFTRQSVIRRTSAGVMREMQYPTTELRTTRIAIWSSEMLLTQIARTSGRVDKQLQKARAAIIESRALLAPAGRKQAGLSIASAGTAARTLACSRR
jgi:hypothetical protein